MNICEDGRPSLQAGARSLASLPQFCSPIVKEGEPGLAYGIDFWAVAPSGNAAADYECGAAFAEEAIRYARDHNRPIFLFSTMLWEAMAELDRL